MRSTQRQHCAQESDKHVQSAGRRLCLAHGNAGSTAASGRSALGCLCAVTRVSALLSSPRSSPHQHRRCCHCPATASWTGGSSHRRRGSQSMTRSRRRWGTTGAGGKPHSTPQRSQPRSSSWRRCHTGHQPPHSPVHRGQEGQGALSRAAATQRTGLLTCIMPAMKSALAALSELQA